MNIHNIKKPLEKILHRLESLEPDQDLHPLDHNFFTTELQKAYNALYQIDSSKSSVDEYGEGEHPGKNTLFEFEEEQLAEKESKSKENSPKTESAAPKPSPSAPPAPKKEPSSPAQTTPEKQAAVAESSEVKEEPKEKSAPPQTKTEEGSSSASFAPDVQELFQIKESSELSERLSRLPITDIWSAMGLNERIFTQNELFDGQAESFQKTVKELNDCQTFEEAKELLAYGPIDNFDWTEPERRNIAKNFIRLIKRKYS